MVNGISSALCEPEPVLNLGWFNGPAYRGMLMHTKVFGKYNGPEDVMERTDGYTEINVIDNYAPSAKAVITVTDANGEAGEGRFGRIQDLYLCRV